MMLPTETLPDHIHDGGLTLRDVNVYYPAGDKPVWALRDFTCQLDERTSYGLVGESGSGKTTLARCILRLLPEACQVSGNILFQGQDLLTLTSEEFRHWRWEKMAIVFQEAMNSFSPVHRISTHFEDVYREHRPGSSLAEIRQQALAALAQMNLSEISYDAFPHELSGGMLQRVSIALNLLAGPEFLVLDEATTALDVLTEQKILDEILALEAQKPILRLTITHDVSVVAKSCRKVIVMYAGRLMEMGDVAAVFEHPRHPYTRSLLASRPSFAKRGKPLAGIPGTIPDLREVGPACPFAPRCEHAQAICREEAPAWQGDIAQRYACHFPCQEVAHA